MTTHRYLIGLALSGSMLLAAVAALAVADDPQDKGAGAVSERPVPRELVRVQTIEAPAEIATVFAPPLRCDQDGNLYLQSENFGVSAVRKLSPKGERLATYDLYADPSVKAEFSDTFALDRDGNLYALVYAHEITRYVFVYRADGRYKSTIKLDPGFAWGPNVLAVFSSGDLLIAGSRYARGSDKQIQKIPFAGLFRSDGTLLKEITLEEDVALQELAEAGDKMLTSPRAPGANLAISFSQAVVGQDGNLYFLRWFNPAIIYAIAPSGEVLRKFTIDPGDASFLPMAMHVSGNRMAVQFFQPDTGKRLMKIVDLEGHEIATYSHSTKDADRSVGVAFVCYRAEPQQFTFLGATSESKLQLIIAEGR